MKKQILFVSAFALTFAFASCGGASDEAKVEDTAVEQVEEIVKDTKEEVADIKDEAAAEIEEVKKDAKKDIKKVVKENDRKNTVDTKNVKEVSAGTKTQMEKQIELNKEAKEGIENAKKDVQTVERKPRQ